MMLPIFENPEYGEWLASQESYSAIRGGQVVACGGVIQVWEGRAQVWGLLGRNLGGSGMVALTRLVMEKLEGFKYRRIEATCDVNFSQAHRWLKMLGFTMETPCMKAFRPDGGDESMYIIIR